MSTNPYGDPSDAPKKGGAGKIFMVLGVGCLVVVALCCGGCLVLSYFGQDMAKNIASEDPAVVTTVASSIADLDIPAEFSPKLSMNIKVPFVGQTVLAMAMFGHDTDENSYLLLMQSEMPDANAEQMIGQMETQMSAQGEDQPRVQVQESTTEEITVKGEARPFTFGQGTVEGSETQYWQVSGSFPGKSGDAAIMIVAPVDNYSREELIAIIESIQ